MTGFLTVCAEEAAMWWHARCRDAAARLSRSHTRSLAALVEHRRARVLAWTVGGYRPDGPPKGPGS